MKVEVASFQWEILLIPAKREISKTITKVIICNNYT